MNVAGLNSLGISKASTNAQPSKPSSSRDSKSSFENALGQAQGGSKDQAPKQDVVAKRERAPDQNPSEQKAPEQKPNTQNQNEAKGQETNLRSSGPQVPNATPGQAMAVRDPMSAPKSPENTEMNDVANEDAVPMENAEAISGPTGAPATMAPGLADRIGNNPAANANASAAINLAKPAVLQQDDPTNSLTRRVVWNDFLRKMNDMGVSAEDVLHAFGSLTKEELAQPPEKNVDKVVMALGLDGQQAMLAKQYFTDLLQKTKSKSLGEELSASQKQMSLTLLSQRDVQRKVTDKSLNEMNHDFFMDRGQRVMQQPQGQMDPANPNSNMRANEGRDEKGEGSKWLAGKSIGEESLAGTALKAPAAQPVAGTPTAGIMQNPEMNKVVAQMKQPAASDKKSIDELIRNFNSREATAPQAGDAAGAQAHAAKLLSAHQLGQQVAAVGPQQEAVAAQGPARATVPSNNAPAMSALGGIWGSGKDSSKDSSSEDKGDDNSPSSYMTGAAIGGDRLNNTNVKGDFQTQLAQGPQGPQQMSVPDMVQQAHIMVKDGGGEMKVTLHPDGLGEVSMRVSVTDGKVNVQMITESDEAKKLIERQIGDLKSGLTANHLQVDSIKIDTASNLGKQLEQQYQDAQRQQTQSQWEQFRQDSQGWRRSFFDTPSVNPYEGQGRAPRDIPNANAAASARAKSLGSRRLDLVA